MPSVQKLDLGPQGSDGEVTGSRGRLASETHFETSRLHTQDLHKEMWGWTWEAQTKERRTSFEMEVNALTRWMYTSVRPQCTVIMGITTAVTANVY